jgi:hypothetical protein
MVEPNQGRPRRLVPDGYGPVWDADGASVYFSRYRSSIWRLDVGQNVLTQVRDGDLLQHDLVGNRLVFTRFSNRSQIYSMPLN